METASQLAARLSSASRRKYYNVYDAFDWPAKLDPSKWYMPPELISIFGTPSYDALSEEQRRRLSLCEVGNLFSFVLQGEVPVVGGMVSRLYSKSYSHEITEYLHHFADEENKHMVMFGEFCHRYLGKIYPEKKIPIAREFAEGEEDVDFYCKVMVVEELGDFYNVLIERDERIDPLVRQINRVHHIDEARHLAFGRAHLAELFQHYSPKWSAQMLAGFRSWLANYLKSSWGDFYNPATYRDAGLADGYEIRQMALAHPACAAHRQRASAKLVKYLVDTGLLAAAPAL